MSEDPHIESDDGLSAFEIELRDKVRARLDELRPLVEEHDRLAAAEVALAGVAEAPEPAPARRGRGRSKA